MTTRRQRITIPDDWTEGEWSCVVVRWPDSPMWRAILRGFLSTPAVGRYWDEETGSVKDAQSTGFEIIGRNIPLVDCEGEAITDEGLEPQKQIVYVGLDAEESDIMGWLCGVNPHAFKIEDGVLYVKDFCGEWNEVGALTSPTEVVPGGVWPEEEPAADYYGCGKASNLINYLLALSDAAWANYDNPTTIEASMRAAVPMATLSRARIYQWVAQIMELDLAGLDETHFNNETANQLARCKAAENVADTAEGTGDERGAVVEAMASAYYNTVGLMTKELWFTYWHFAAETIGDQDCRLILSLGAKDSEADCECPDAGGVEPVYDWDYKYDLQSSQNGWIIVATNGNYVPGSGLNGNTGTGAQGNFEAPDRSGGEYAGTITLVEVQLAASPGTVNETTFGYAGVAYMDDIYGTYVLEAAKPDWEAGSGVYSSGPISRVYTAESGQKVRIALRLEGQASVGFAIRRVRIAGTGEPLVAAPIVSYP